MDSDTFDEQFDYRQSAKDAELDRFSDLVKAFSKVMDEDQKNKVDPLQPVLTLQDYLGLLLEEEYEFLITAYTGRTIQYFHANGSLHQVVWGIPVPPYAVMAVSGAKSSPRGQLYALSTTREDSTKLLALKVIQKVVESMRYLEAPVAELPADESTL